MSNSITIPNLSKSSTWEPDNFPIHNGCAVIAGPSYSQCMDMGILVLAKRLPLHHSLGSSWMACEISNPWDLWNLVETKAMPRNSTAGSEKTPWGSLHGGCSADLAAEPRLFDFQPLELFGPFSPVLPDVTVPGLIKSDNSFSKSRSRSKNWVENSLQLSFSQKLDEQMARNHPRFTLQLGHALQAQTAPTPRTQRGTSMQPQRMNY